jgi:hypothetical protein
MPVLAAAFVLSGCQYLFGGMMGAPLVPPLSGLNTAQRRKKIRVALTA